MMQLNTLQPAVGSKSARHRVTSLTRRFCEEVRLNELQGLSVEEIDLAVLKAANIVSARALSARVIQSGEISRKVVLRGLSATKGAKAAIEAAGGSVEE